MASVRCTLTLPLAAVVCVLVVTGVAATPGVAAGESLAATVAQDSSAVEASLALDRSTRRLIQQGLRNEGFDRGRFGLRTRAAIRDWQQSRGASPTGYLNRAEAELLRTAAPPPPVPEAPPPPDAVAAVDPSTSSAAAAPAETDSTPASPAIVTAEEADPQSAAGGAARRRGSRPLAPPSRRNRGTYPRRTPLATCTTTAGGCGATTRKLFAGTAEPPNRETPIAQYNLGHMYEQGHGVGRDRVEAAKWYSLAAEQGHDEARKRLDDLR